VRGVHGFVRRGAEGLVGRLGSLGDVDWDMWELSLGFGRGE